jgi:CRISPR-associated protein Cas1
MISEDIRQEYLVFLIMNGNMGFSKVTLHYMKKNAKFDKLFALNAQVREIKPVHLEVLI